MRDGARPEPCDTSRASIHDPAGLRNRGLLDRQGTLELTRACERHDRGN